MYFKMILLIKFFNINIYLVNGIFKKFVYFNIFLLMGVYWGVGGIFFLVGAVVI